MSSNRSGVLILSPFQKPYTKALGKDGILVQQEASVMHHHSAERADLFLRNFDKPEEIDSILMREKENQLEENKHILQQLLRAVEFLAKQALPVDFYDEETNRGNFIAILQLMAKGDSLLHKHLLTAKRNAIYTSKTIQNEVIHIYASLVLEKLTKNIRENKLPFTIIADETTDRHSNQEIISVSLRFVDLSSFICIPYCRKFY